MGTADLRFFLQMRIMGKKAKGASVAAQDLADALLLLGFEPGPVDVKLGASALEYIENHQN